jgi:hypothetical protein
MCGGWVGGCVGGWVDEWVCRPLLDAGKTHCFDHMLLGVGQVYLIY